MVPSISVPVRLAAACAQAPFWTNARSRLLGRGCFPTVPEAGARSLTVPRTASKLATRSSGRVSGLAPAAETQTPASSNGSTNRSENVPEPLVKLDNHSDPYHTIVIIEYGDKLGELLDTVASLKALGLNVRRAKVKQSDGAMVKNKFYVTDAQTADKIMKSARLEEIRLTILDNLMRYHPEAAEHMGWGSRAKKASRHSPLEPLGMKHRAVVRTSVQVINQEDEGFSEVKIVTTDRPGLLTDVVRVLKDISVNVISAEVDTEGPLAKDEFLVTYHGEALNKGMEQLVTNMLQYYLSMGEVEKEESY